MSFAGDIGKYAKNTGLTIDHAVVSICIDATTSIIKRSPEDTGRFRGNWFPAINGVSNETSETRREAEAISAGKEMAKKATGNIFTLSNNLAYAYRLEFEHWSQWAPNGMVRLTALEIEQRLKRL